MTRRIGVFGGSFDPIHLGHLRAAEEVREAFDLERVHFVPAAVPPHKLDRDLTEGALRLRMVELAVADHPAFCASAIEIERGGRSYSVETLAEFRRREPGAEIFFLLGGDAFREIHTWRAAPRLFELAHLVVVRRPPALLETSIAHLPVALQERLCYDPLTRSYRHRDGTCVHFLEITAIDVSSSAIRERIRSGRSIRYLVPPAVDRFVRDHGLYGAA